MTGSVATKRSTSTSPAERSDDEWILQRGAQVLDREAAAIRCAADRLGPPFVNAVRLILSCDGRIAVTGMGKAGDIGKKIQSTLASTGTPAYVLHPVEAMHGDLGMIRSQDVVIALSKSGESQELSCLLPSLRKFGCRVILLTARADSRCARFADVVLDIGDTPEACPLGMAPSSSTAAMLAVGDALALTAMELKRVQPEQFARLHPGGSLGRSLMRVHEIMRTGADCPTIRAEQTVLDYDLAVRRAPRRAGAAAVVDGEGKLVGILTHGDVSRLLAQPEHPAKRTVQDVMTQSPKVIHRDALVAEALSIMQPHRIDELPVVDDDHHVVGMIDIQDLVAEGFSCFDSR